MQHLAPPAALLAALVALAGCGARGATPETPTTEAWSESQAAPWTGGGAPSGAVALQPPQRGRATYYSDKLIGRKTASGERYDAKAMTAAHRTLPFGTVVEVA